MANIKNQHLLFKFTEDDLNKMENAALDHKRYNNISFKILDYIPKQKVVIQCIQLKNAAEAYHDQKRLIEIVHETFDRFFQDCKVHVHATAYKIPDPFIVDHVWISKQMMEKNIKLKFIASETGIDYTQLSALVSGTRPLSSLAKAMFYFYFKSKK